MKVANSEAADKLGGGGGTFYPLPNESFKPFIRVCLLNMT
jgi:hypothetical protein